MKSKSIDYGCQVPVIAKADVVVVGGGPGGLGAAVMAARQGAKVLLIERYGQLGGMAVAGEVHPFMMNHALERSLDHPVYTDWIAAMHKYLPPSQARNNPLEGEAFKDIELNINKEHAALAAEDLCLEAGVELLYHHTFVDAITSDRRIRYIVAHSKSGLVAIEAPVFIDASGDADLAARAGNRTEFGGPSGYCQPMTLCFKMGRVDRKRMPTRQEMTKLYLAAVERGEVDCPREDVLFFFWLEEDIIHFNTTRVIRHSAVDGVELSKAEIMGRRQLRHFVKFLRSEVPGFEEATIHSMANHIGVRESRRVVGRVMLTREAFVNEQKFPDAISRVRYAIDIHNPDGKGTVIQTLPENAWYEIPYGCIVAADIDNLLIAGRPISVDHAIHSSTRVMAPSVSIGQAAGMAAAMMTQQGLEKAQDVDGVALREALRKAGANL